MIFAWMWSVLSTRATLQFPVIAATCNCPFKHARPVNSFSTACCNPNSFIVLILRWKKQLINIVYCRDFAAGVIKPSL